jgi:UDP-3-O-[3-hydroxymyristoyl] glucosamine N-acyltransferase
VAKIEEASASDLCFISNKKYQHFLQSTKAGALIIDKNLESLVTHQTVIICEMPYVAFCTALITYFDYKNTYSGIHPTAIIENSAKIGKNVYIGPNVYVGRDTEIGNNSKIYANTSIYENSKIGDDTIIYSNVSIYYQSKIGNKCIIHSGAVIGSDGFGHAPLPDGTYIKIPQIGNVIIEDDVEIGSNTSVDRANMGSTIIRKGSRIDNLVQIAHGVEIGTNTVVAAQTGISGSTKIGNNVVLAGQVGLVGHITIADGVQIGAQSGVNKSIVEKGGQYSDSPHLPIKNALKSRVLYKNLPQLEQRIRELESQIKKLNTEIE